MPRSLEDFIALNDPSPDAASTTLGQPVFKDRPTNKTGTSVLRELEALGLIEGLGANATLNSGSGASTANAKTARNTALKQLEIQRRRLEFQKKTGLRDIEQARTKGLRGAINNALQRGIFQSGIREFNEAEVNREQDEAGSDLKTQIGLSLESLAAQREGLQAQKFGGSGSGAGATNLDLLGIDEAKELAPDLAAAQNAAIAEQNKNARHLQGINTGEGAPSNLDTGLLQHKRPPAVTAGRPS